jgi:hypothetical protein
LPGPGFVGGNGKVRAVWREVGFHDLRVGFFEEEQPTFFPPGRNRYQLDHVFADAETRKRVSDRHADRTPI